MRDGRLQEEADADEHVRLSVRSQLLSDASTSRVAQLHLRLQDGGTSFARKGESDCHRSEIAENLIRMKNKRSLKTSRLRH